MERILTNILGCLDKSRKKKSPFQAFVGFDGFVDTLVKPVRLAKSPEQLIFFNTIKEFGEYLMDKSGKSCSIELHKMTEKMGGNTAIYASAISSLGIHTRCVGAFGYPEVMEAFKEQGEGHVELVSISNPGLCTALEFMDGKVMLSENQGINDINYEVLKERLGAQRLYHMIWEADIISLMNWSEVPGTTDIWRGLTADVFEVLPKHMKKKMFIDISDCSRRSASDIETMLEMISTFTDYCEVTLSLNQNEFEILCKAKAIPLEEEGFEAAGEYLRRLCPVAYLVIHFVKGACAFSDNGCCHAKNRYVKQPLISTGGGDNFNAGLSYGIMLGLDIGSAMYLANAASGFYVTHGHSASLEEIIDYLVQWQCEEEPQ